MIDRERLAELKAEVGEEAFEEILVVFLDEVDEAVGRLTAQPPTDADSLRAELHFLKGSGLNLGLSDFAELCRLGEERAAQGQMVDLAPILDSYRAARAALLAHQTGAA